MKLTVGFTIASLVSVLCCSGCATSPTGRRQANLVSDDQTRQMGDQAWTEVRAKYKETSDQAVRDFVNKVAARVIAAGSLAKEKWDVIAFDSKEVNAFALPGGHIGVFTGIIPVAGNEAGLATVLAHETGHVIARHSQERVSDELVSQGLMGVVGAVIGNPAAHPAVMSALGLGAQVGFLLPFSRSQEAEADHEGLLIMSQAGYDPNEAISFWNRMVAANPGEPPAFLSDHPATSDRIAALKARAGRRSRPAPARVAARPPAA
ncbi:MAG: M48 family metallopeptidase [Deltaproteobacteria bacterium]|nr:M48 family metallopeptidase [Deltaproteobacteria bacterium]